MGNVAWSWINLVVECKYDLDANPFKQNYPESGGAASASSRAQLIKYVAELFRRQHRLFVYAIIIVRDSVRLTRWDRTGVLYTKSFSLVDSSDILLRFLYCFARSTPEGRGYDPTAVLASDMEIDKLRSYKTDNTHKQRFLKDIIEHEKEDPIYKVCDVHLYTCDFY